MNFTYLLLNLPAVILLLLIISFFTAISIIITHLFRRYIQPVPKTNYSEIMGHIYGLLGGIYGLLIGFVIVLVWGDYNDTEANAAKEGSLAISLYREIRYFPDTAKAQPLRKAYLTFVNAVLKNEYPKMAALRPFAEEDDRPIDDVYKQLELLNVTTARSNKMVEHLDEMAMYRNLRQIGAFADIPTIIWLPLLLGYLILMICALFLDIESVRRHLLVNGLLGAFVGIMVYIILLINHPYAGGMKIEPDLYRSIVEMESDGR